MENLRGLFGSFNANTALFRHRCNSAYLAVLTNVKAGLQSSELLILLIAIPGFHRQQGMRRWVLRL